MFISGLPNSYFRPSFQVGAIRGLSKTSRGSVFSASQNNILAMALPGYVRKAGYPCLGMAGGIAAAKFLPHPVIKPIVESVCGGETSLPKEQLKQAELRQKSMSLLHKILAGIGSAFVHSLASQPFDALRNCLQQSVSLKPSVFMIGFPVATFARILNDNVLFGVKDVFSRAISSAVRDAELADNLATVSTAMVSMCVFAPTETFRVLMLKEFNRKLSGGLKVHIAVSARLCLKMDMALGIGRTIGFMPLLKAGIHNVAVRDILFTYGMFTGARKITERFSDSDISFVRNNSKLLGDFCGGAAAGALTAPFDAGASVARARLFSGGISANKGSACIAIRDIGSAIGKIGFKNFLKTAGYRALGIGLGMAVLKKSRHFFSQIA
jgi:hypothetical protein